MYIVVGHSNFKENKMTESTIIYDVQEYLQEWEKVNNPFYPHAMRWDRLKVTELLSDYKKQFERSDNSDYAVPPPAPPKLPSFNDVIYKMVADKKEICLMTFYESLKKLGNFS
jgi:hypothetical protein